MKDIKSKMAAVAPVATTENITGKKRNSADNGHKKHGFFKGVIKVFKPRKSKEHDQETKKEPTVEDIEEQIDNKQLLEATKDLLDVEDKILQDPLLQDKMTEVNALYRKLEAAVFKVIMDSITQTDGDLLSEAVNVIVEMEKEDAQNVPHRIFSGSSWPRGWRLKWEQNVEITVTERFGDLNNFLLDDFNSSLSQNIATLGKILKQDLVHVVTHLKDHYPKEFDVCNIYAKNYYWYVVSQMELITGFQLAEEDTYLLLCWVKNYYPNLILKDHALIGHIDDSKLQDLLSPDVIRQLEETYLRYERESVITYMNRSLDLEMSRWKSGKEPEILGNCHHTELNIDVVQIYSGILKRAGEINKEMVGKVSCFLPYEMEEFFKRYKSSLEEFLEKNKTHAFYREIGITNLNCCLHFREFIENKDTAFDEGLRLEMLCPILQCEDLIYDALFQELYRELKTQFKRMSQSNSLCSFQIMQDVVKTAERFVPGFTTLCARCHKDMIARIHLHLVKEYLTRLLKKKVRHNNVLQLQTLASQMNENANLINGFCAAHKSETEWIKPVISKIAEIIRLQDLCAIQLEVATMVEDYPDIGNKQIEYILYIKGNLSSKDIKSILKVANTVERRTSTKPKLFELIKT
ncbi:tumor necrosis factor alpha-induced protein 2 isoform 1-T2 [Anomaloglossus baeobatrachus]|uniref:tumor necrosis factor alpha-induced protein 2-like n=1 Tax=Anomaloglossus baeobatrachus TaxID=238106 RepID=UPI003F507B5A